MVTYEKVLNKKQEIEALEPTSAVDLAWKNGFLTALNFVIIERTPYVTRNI